MNPSQDGVGRGDTIDPEVPDRNTLGTLFDLAGLAKGLQSGFINAYLGHEGSIEDFWQGIGAQLDLDAGMVETLQLTLQLGVLTQNHPPLVKLVLGMRDVGTITDLRGLVGFTSDDWRKLIESEADGERIGVPPIVPGETDEEKATTYAGTLSNLIEDAMPTAVFSHRLRQDDRPRDEDLKRFFTANPDFELRATRVGEYLARNPGALDGAGDLERLKLDLQATERLFNVAPRFDKYDAVRGLRDNGFDSALAIQRMGGTGFVTNYGEALGGESRARTIHTAAEGRAAVALHLYAQHSAAMNSLGVFAIADPAAPGGDSSLPDAPEGFDWQSLFGSLDLCECEHCRSVLSPAAYLVDLLHFLDQRSAQPVEEGQSVLNVLLLRRPDLGEIELNCQNTNTVLPYVDLVNEILENAVRPVPRFNYQTTAPAAELAVQPEHLHTPAYDRLAKAKYPWTLPFDLWVAEARTYLNHLGVPRYRLMDCFRRDAAFQRAPLAVAAEFLGLTPFEREIITGTAPGEPHEMWGFTRATDFQDLVGETVDVLLDRAGLSYEELTELLAVDFIDPEGKLDIDLGANCQLDQATVPNLDEEVLKRLHRFVRLQRKLGWQIHELGRTLAALAPGELTDGFLRDLWRIETLRAELRVPLIPMLAWWSDIDTRGHGDEPPLYDRLFLNPTVNRPVEEAFELGDDRQELKNTNQKILDNEPVIPVILGALGIPADDLALLVAEELANDDLNLANLSRLHRAVTLARALDLSMADYRALRTLAGLDPFASQGPVATVEFVETAQQVKNSGFSLAELDYLLRHRLTTAAPRDEEIGLLLAEVRTGLRKIAAEHTFDSDPTGQRQRNAGESLIEEKLAGALGLELAVAEALLTRWVPAPENPSITVFLKLFDTESNEESVGTPLSAEDWPEAFKTFHLLEKIAIFFTRLELGLPELDFLFRRGPGLGWLDLKALPVDAASAEEETPDDRLRALSMSVRVLGLRSVFGEPALIELLESLHGTDLGLGVFLEKVEEATGWPLADLSFLTGDEGFELSFPQDYRSGLTFQWFQRCFELLRRLGISAAEAWQWATPEATVDQARAIKQAVKAKYDDENWLAVAQPLRDELREKQRRALVAHLVHPLRFDNANDLFAHFLIDIEMSPCMMTSRIKQAISSVQLFVQRGMMNLEPASRDEPGVVFEPGDVKEWQWRKNYRVWEANRKVFLWPENWIEPELRDDKSPFFTDLENELLQDEVTQASAEGAFLHYLENLDGVARLEISGLYREGEGKSSILHVVARTRGTPHLYYYRQWIGQRRWTAWTRIGVDIEGDHLVPVVYNRRLYLFWPVFFEKAVEETAELNEPQTPRRFYEIKLAWTEYENGRWLAKRMTDPFITTQYPDDPVDPRSRFSFWSYFNAQNQLIIASEIREVGGGSRVYPRQLRFIGVDGQVDSPPRTEINVSDSLAGTAKNFNALVESDDTALEMITAARPTGGGGGGGPDGIEERKNFFAVEKELTLQTTPGTFSLMLPHAERPFSSQSPFFYQDETRTFFVVPKRRLDFAGPDFGSTFDFNKVAPETIDIVRFAFAEFWQFQPSDSLTFDTGGVGDRDLFVFREVDFGSRFPDRGFGNRDFLSGENSQGSDLFPIGTGAIPRLAHVTIWSDFPGFDPFAGDHVLRDPEAPEEDAFPGYHWQAYSFRFDAFYHPYVCRLIGQLNRHGIDGLLDPDPQGEDPQLRRQELTETFFDETYDPTSIVDQDHYPRDEFDFDDGGYAIYNWELFFHTPFLIAIRLSANQRFAEAQRWFHYIFDPTDVSSAAEGAERFWKVKPFTDPGRTLIELFLLLGSKDPEDPQGEERRKLIEQIDEWRADPFNPHLIARLRPVAYQKAVVLAYLDNLIAWGDQLFRRDTIESINEATLLYVLAAEILGQRPRTVPAHQEASKIIDDVEVKTFNDLRRRLDAFSNALVQLENAVGDSGGAEGDSGGASQAALGPTLFFCIPRNEKLLSYWDTVEDRLFKIRHCMNIEGVARQLALFEPRVDPGLLVRAAAAGVDLSSALNDLSAPLPHYRFSFMVQKAVEIVGDVRGLGSALLQALEKKDAEEIALLRSGHEIRVLEAVRQVRERQVAEAGEALEALRKSQTLAELRRDYYRSREYMNVHEKLQLKKLEAANELQSAGQLLEIVAAELALIPDFDLGTEGFAASPVVKVRFGGSSLSSAVQIAARELSLLASIESHKGTMASIKGGYDRRADDWTLQGDLAVQEIEQIKKQIIAAEIRLAIAEGELDNHDLQMENAKNIDISLREKFTNQELYGWMVSQISSLYFQSYQLAYDVAKRAERALRHELADPQASFIRFGYWDSLKKGLLAGDKLHYDLKRMDLAYVEQNRREYEITQHVSLARVDPTALVSLRQAGSCFVEVPEAVFDLEYPGHYLRRLKSVSLSVPSVTGPYTNVSCKLTLLGNRTRHQTGTDRGYAWTGDNNDGRFRYDTGGIQSMVTSSARQDGGLFELNLRDERYLPFEGAGAISSWRLELPAEFRHFDYDTITDVIFHLGYTARDGGDGFRTKVEAALKENLKALMETGGAKGLWRLFSARREFPDEWHRFLHAAAGEDHTMNLALHQDRFAAFVLDKEVRIEELLVFLELADSSIDVTQKPLTLDILAPGDTSATAAELSEQLSQKLGGLPHVTFDFAKDPKDLGDWRLTVSQGSLADTENALTREVEGELRLDPRAFKDLGLLCRYTVVPPGSPANG